MPGRRTSSHAPFSAGQHQSGVAWQRPRDTDLHVGVEESWRQVPGAASGRRDAAARRQQHLRRRLGGVARSARRGVARTAGELPVRCGRKGASVRGGSGSGSVCVCVCVYGRASACVIEQVQKVTTTASMNWSSPRTGQCDSLSFRRGTQARSRVLHYTLQPTITLSSQPSRNALPFHSLNLLPILSAVHPPSTPRTRSTALNPPLPQHSPVPPSVLTEQPLDVRGARLSVPDPPHLLATRLHQVLVLGNAQLLPVHDARALRARPTTGSTDDVRCGAPEVGES